jgi:hypothetical protein
VVWPKLTVSDYPEMLRKLSTAAFLVTIACTSLVRSQVPTIDQYLGSLDLTSKVGVYSIPVPVGTLLVAAIVAVLSESVKLHDKISRALGTRAVFDVRWILLPMALLSGAVVDRKRFDRISTDRRRLMNEVFYKYASSAKTADIDGHLITQALTAWSWYWMCVESLVILGLTGALLAWFADWGATALIFAIMLMTAVAHADFSSGSY